MDFQMWVAERAVDGIAARSRAVQDAVRMHEQVVRLGN